MHTAITGSAVDFIGVPEAGNDVGRVTGLRGAAAHLRTGLYSVAV
jgi:hypothetical protein